MHGRFSLFAFEEFTFDVVVVGAAYPRLSFLPPLPPTCVIVVRIGRPSLLLVLTELASSLMRTSVSIGREGMTVVACRDVDAGVEG